MTRAHAVLVTLLNRWHRCSHCGSAVWRREARSLTEDWYCVACPDGAFTMMRNGVEFHCLWLDMNRAMLEAWWK